MGAMGRGTPSGQGGLMQIMEQVAASPAIQSLAQSPEMQQVAARIFDG
jgi:hypothetical protein